ncbi:MAG: hypothetical protein IKU11_02060 [Clostridia bacterium]|nr:hypothetical protein [Clostridia bacterium]
MFGKWEKQAICGEIGCDIAGYSLYEEEKGWEKDGVKGPNDMENGYELTRGGEEKGFSEKRGSWQRKRKI